MMRILIATGIYPPEVGGPAYYAQELERVFPALGYDTCVVTYGFLKRLPTGLRHLAYIKKLFLVMLFWRPTYVLALDTFSVGLPAVFVARFMRTKVIIRTGGDFLWEQYVERTGEKILFHELYNARRNYTRKERAIFWLTRWTLQHATHVVFSTKYQQDVFVSAYKLDDSSTSVIENSYGTKEPSTEPSRKNFVCFTRQLKWKNLDVLKGAFAIAKKKHTRITLDTGEVSRQDLHNVLEIIKGE